MRYLPLIFLSGLLSGCANTNTPNYDLRFGQAVRQAREAMTLNPQAALSPAPVVMDGMSAREATERYRDSFKAPPPVVNVINIGGAIGGGGGR